MASKTAFATIYRFMYPKHFNFLMPQGMFVRWTPEWAFHFPKRVKCDEKR